MFGSRPYWGYRGGGGALSWARGVRAVHADPRQVEGPDRLGDAEVVRGVLDVAARLVLPAVRVRVVHLLREEAEDALPVRDLLEDRLPRVPGGVRRVAPRGGAETLEELHVPAHRVGAPGLRLHAVPEHVLLALPRGPRRLAGHRAGLARETTWTS